MGEEHRIAINLLMLSVALFGGCSPGSWSTDKFSAQVASADHVVVSDSYHGSTLVVSGHEAAAWTRTITAAKGLPKDQSAATAPCCKMEFFNQTNLLGAIMLQEDWFAIVGAPGEYIDKSGALKALQRRLESDKQAGEAWIHELPRRPVFSKLQTWSVEALQRFDRGDLKLRGDGEIKDLEFQQRIEGAVRATYLFMPRVSLRRSRSGPAEYLQFDWGHYGLLVGPSNFVTAFEAPYMTDVAPGIYGYHLR